MKLFVIIVPKIISFLFKKNYIAEEKTEGEVMDMMHGIPFIAADSICSGTVTDAGADADIVIITAGVAQKSGDSCRAD
jgi:Malate/lactate dehydrogenases